MATTERKKRRGPEPAWDWETILKPRGRATSRTLTLTYGTDFGPGTAHETQPHTMAQYVRVMAKRYGYSAAVRVDGPTVTAVVTRKSG